VAAVDVVRRETVPCVAARGIGLRWGLATAAFLLAALLVGLAVGPAGIGAGAIVESTLSSLPFLHVHSPLDAFEHAVLWQVRAPRVALAALVGGMLAVSGSAYQGVFRNPLADPYLLGVAGGAGLGATLAIVFQIVGWVCQLFAVWMAMRAFDIHAPLPAAAVVLLLMNVATVFPLWPGNVGLVQVAIATPLTASYGVNYPHGVAFGFGLQAIEASVGIGVGLLFLAREGLSFAMLRVMPSAAQAEMGDGAEQEETNGRHARARVPF